jgi:hypothetical protein
MEGSDSRRSYRLPNLHMKQPARIDEAQFLSTLCIRVADASHFTHAGHGGGSDYRVGILLAFWPSELFPEGRRCGSESAHRPVLQAESRRIFRSRTPRSGAIEFARKDRKQ